MHLPHQRALSSDAKAKAERLLELQANKKLVQHQLSQETGKVVLLKELTNISSLLKQKVTDCTIAMLKTKYGMLYYSCIYCLSSLLSYYPSYPASFLFLVGASIEVHSDENKNLKGIFIQDKEMKDAFSAYPELLCTDATYKLLQLGFPLYLMLCEDSNGQSELVAACILVTEDFDSVKWMMEAFKQHNSSWDKVQVVMADKDISERDVIKQCLPNASVVICLFHALRSFRREITCEKMGISSGQRMFCLEMIQRMAHATSETEYSQLYEQFRQDAPREVVLYFSDHWHTIKNEWVLGLKFGGGSFLNSTNNRLESINGKLKQVINKHSSLEDFVKNFFVILNTLRIERDHKAAIMFQKVQVQPFPVNSPESEYSKLLTPYAADFVIKQIRLADKVKEITQAEEEWTVETSQGQKVVNLSRCSCIFQTSMTLPCRHMFALRKQLQLPLFDPSICNKRWTSAYYRTTQRLFSQSSSRPTLIVTASKAHCRKLSQHEKFRKASVQASELASVASLASNVHFDRRIALLKDLAERWKNGTEVGLVDLDDDDDYGTCGLLHAWLITCVTPLFTGV